jgi:hypothetical protein
MTLFAERVSRRSDEAGLCPGDLHEGDELLFRVERSRAVIGKTPDLLALAGSVVVPPAKKGTSWDDVLRATRRERAERRH